MMRYCTFIDFMLCSNKEIRIRVMYETASKGGSEVYKLSSDKYF